MDGFKVFALAAGMLAMRSVTAAPDASPSLLLVAPITIPFTLHHGHIVLSAELQAGHPLPFVFDSGLTVGNVVTTDTAQALGLESKGLARYRDSSGEAGSTGVAMIPSVRVGSAVLPDQRFAIARVPDALTARKGQTPIAGFIGAPLMQDAVLCIDYRHRKIVRWPRASFDGAALAAIPMPSNHGLPTIEVNIDGLQATLVVDSGNNGGVELFPAFAETNDLAQRYPDLKSFQGMSGGGRTFDVLTGTADTVKVGDDTRLSKVSLSLIAQAMDPDWGIDGLAGYAFLSRLNPCLDRDGARFMWAQ